MKATKTPAPKELDEETLHKAQKGVPTACRCLVTTYQKPIFAVLWRMLEPAGKGALVEDLAQETFLRAFRALPDFELAGPAKLSTWLLTIATRLALNELRRKTHDTISVSHTVPVLAASQTDEPLRQRQMAEAVDWALSRLGPEFRAVFLLSRYHELHHQDIAQVLGVKVGTVKSRLSRATQQMTSLLARYYDGKT